jgi:hypothetical protein
MSKILQVWKANNFGKGVLNGSQDFFRITPDPSTSGGGAVDSVNGQTGVVVLDKSDIGLDQVDNTSDANKPISTATQTALNERVRVLICDRTKVNITGVNVLTVAKTYLIPGGTLTGFARLKIECMGLKQDNTGNGQYRIYGGTSSTFSTATADELRRIVVAGVQYLNFVSNFELRNNDLEGIRRDSASAAGDEGVVVNLPKTTVTYNRANDYYIHLVYQPNSVTEQYSTDLVTITAFREKNTI